MRRKAGIYRRHFTLGRPVGIGREPPIVLQHGDETMAGLRRLILGVEGCIAVLLGLTEVITAGLFAFGPSNCPRADACQSIFGGAFGGPFGLTAMMAIWAPLLWVTLICLVLARHGIGRGDYNPGLVWCFIVTLFFNSWALLYGAIYMIPVVLLAILGGVMHVVAGQFRSPASGVRGGRADAN